ncbi:hypothetical protein G6F56_013497 [Rhizopus delemar]|nr:hypothetical protein G6F56_013497 [Rhizopus delemar]
MPARTFGPRLWNRDLAACLNMLHIIRFLRTEGDTPDRFNRDAPGTGTGTRRRRQQQSTERRVRPRPQ